MSNLKILNSYFLKNVFTLAIQETKRTRKTSLLAKFNPCSPTTAPPASLASAATPTPTLLFVGGSLLLLFLRRGSSRGGGQNVTRLAVLVHFVRRCTLLD